MTKPLRRRPRPDIDQARIVAEALALIDECGLAALSMRSLAERLQVYPTTIYWYVDTSSALLAAVVKHALGDILPDAAFEPASWQDWTRALMRSYRAAVMRHPNIAPLLGADLTSNPGVDITVVEKLLCRLENAGFRDDALLHAYNSVMAGMIGFVTLELSTAPKDDERWAESLRDSYREADPVQFPSVRRWAVMMENRAFVVRWQNGATAPMSETFETFIEALLIGLDAALRRNVRS
jgi:TetR/AcrR family transcriptional regulator, tetracycline repressor protein